MFKIIYPESDATLYEAVPATNTGLDEILEIGKRITTSVTSSYSFSRSLLKFDMNDVSSTLSKYGVGLDDCKFVLQLYTTHAKNLPATYTINANLVGDDWTQGTGFLNYVNSKVIDGVTWNAPKSGSYFWTSGSQQINVPSGSLSSLYISGSGKGGSWLYQSGSGIYSSSFYSQSFYTQPGMELSESFSTRPSDINIDVTGAVKTWMSGSGGFTIPNYGFLLKFSESDEADSAVQGFVRFFSRDTHTIYVPRLTMYFDKSAFATGSLSAIDMDSFTTYTKLKKSYKDTEVTKIRLYARDKFPQKSPTNTFPMTTVKYLPSDTLYSLVDAATDEVIIPYDNIYTKVSCDSTSNFIYMDMTGLMPERYYRLEFKIVNSFLEEYINDKFFFKVTR